MAEIEQPKNSNSFGTLLLGLVLGGGAVALIEEYRLSAAQETKDSLVQKANNLIEHATPIVSAAAQSQGISSGFLGNMGQSLPLGSSDVVTATKEHAVQYGEALRDLREATTKK